MFVGGGNDVVVNQRTELITIVSEKWGYSVVEKNQTINAMSNTSDIINAIDRIFLFKLQIISFISYNHMLYPSIIRVHLLFQHNYASLLVYSSCLCLYFQLTTNIVIAKFHFRSWKDRTRMYWKFTACCLSNESVQMYAKDVR